MAGFGLHFLINDVITLLLGTFITGIYGAQSE